MWKWSRTQDVQSERRPAWKWMKARSKEIIPQPYSLPPAANAVSLYKVNLDVISKFIWWLWLWLYSRPKPIFLHESSSSSSRASQVQLIASLLLLISNSVHTSIARTCSPSPVSWRYYQLGNNCIQSSRCQRLIRSGLQLKFPFSSPHALN